MGRMQETASSEPWCGRRLRGAGPGTGQVAGGGTGGPDPGFPTRAPCPFEAGEEQQGVGGYRDMRCCWEGTHTYLGLLLLQGCHQSSRDAAAVLCPSLLCTSSSPERRVPVSPQLVSPPSCGCPWWRWRRGCLLPPSPPLGAGWERAAHGGAGCCRHAPVLVGVRLPWTSAHQDP